MNQINGILICLDYLFIIKYIAILLILQSNLSLNLHILFVPSGP